MDLQFFSGRGSFGERIYLPRAFRRTVKWLPQIGDRFPNFEATSTHGLLRFYDWAEGYWTILFSHPAAHTPVCTSEIVALADAASELARRRIQPMALSRSSVESQAAWFREIERRYGVQVDFPGVADANGTLCGVFGTIHPKDVPTCPIRKSFILDPDMRIRMIFEYPAMVGRSTEEFIRCIDALQLQSSRNVALPADWWPGEAVIEYDPDKIAAGLRTGPLKGAA